MTTTIVVGFDGRDVSGDALVLARRLAELCRARAVVAAVFPYDARHMDADEYAEALEEGRRRVLVPGLEEFGGSIHADAQALGDHSAPRGLQRFVEEVGADMVVLGSSERAQLGRILTGTTAERLLHGSPCPVAVAPRGYKQSEDGIRVIAAAFDGSQESGAALRLAADLALRAAATLRVIGVLPRADAGPAAAMPARAAWRTQLRDQVHAAAAELPGELRALPIVAEGDPVSVLLGHAEQGIDLMVTGSRGYGPMRRVLLGSVSAALMRASPCPVVVVPRTQLEDDSGQT